jgi:hypothetical protein
VGRIRSDIGNYGSRAEAVGRRRIGCELYRQEVDGRLRRLDEWRVGRGACCVGLTVSSDVLFSVL